MVQDAPVVFTGLSRSFFERRTVLAANDLLFALGVARHRFGLNRKKGSEVIGKLTVEGPGLVNPVLVKVSRKFVESVDGTTMVTRSKPFHVHSRPDWPFHLYQPSFERPGSVVLPARLPGVGAELREDELREEEFIQVGYLSLRSEGPPLRWPLVVKAEVKPASLLRTEVFHLQV